MKAKLNYILGGVLALSFSLVASTGVLLLYDGTGSPGFFASAIHSVLPLMRRIHMILGLLLIAFVAYHVIRNWDFIVCMTEVIRQEHETRNQESGGDEGPGENPEEEYEEIDELAEDEEEPSDDDEHAAGDDEEDSDGRGNQNGI